MSVENARYACASVFSVMAHRSTTAYARNSRMPMRARSNVTTGLRSRNDADSVAVMSTLTSKKGMRMTMAENAREKCSSPAKDSETMKA